MPTLGSAPTGCGVALTAQIIDLPSRFHVPRGNGAREAFIMIGEMFPNTDREDACMWADFMLAELWHLGFKVVPVEDRGAA
jgi:hypothetical protein